MEPNYRRCISCRILAPKPHFIRVVRDYSTGKIELNQGMGRSAYVCPTQDCVNLALKKKRLDRALRSPIPPDFTPALWGFVNIQSCPSETESTAMGRSDVS